jgi:hypothetical protein
MKKSKNTIQRVEMAKDEVIEIEQQLESIAMRIKELPGTKRTAAKLERARLKLEEWRKTA